MGRTKGVIGWVIARNFESALEIDRACFHEDAITRDQLTTLLKQKENVMFGIEVSEKLAGYGIYECNSDSYRVLRLAIHPDYQRQGLGSQLLSWVVRKLSPERRRRVTLIVPDYLLGCHLFLKANGFKATCHGDEYYFMRGVRWNESLQKT